MCGSLPVRWRIRGRRLDRSQGWRPWRVAGAATTVLQCRECGLIFAHPMPVPESLGDHYETDAESYFGIERAGAQEGAFQSEIQRARELLPRVDRLRALDVGAGTGRAMAALRDAGFDTWGIEPSVSFREVALQNYGLDPDRIQQVSVAEATFPEAAFDFITFGAVLEHLPDPGRTIERALSWLRPGGIIHAEVPSSQWLVGRLLNMYFWMTGSGLVTNLSPMHPPYHLFEFSAESFKRHGERTGYALAQYQVLTGDPLVRGLGGSLLRRVMQASGTGMQLVVWLRAA